MALPGEETVELRIVEAAEAELFVDEADLDDVLVRTIHRVEHHGQGRSRVTYRMEISGPAADVAGPQLGPAISADFPELLAALVARAEAAVAAGAASRCMTRAATPLEPNESPGFLLWHATLRWQRGIVEALAPLDLTHVQFVLLASAWWLNQHGGPPNQVALAAHAGTDVKMTSQVVRTLERKRLIEREVDAADTRARRILVTSRGAALAPQAIAVVEEVDTRFFADVPERETLAFLRRLLDSSNPTRGT
jgi:DNA-binding MarR family transcriptional regulator